MKIETTAVHAGRHIDPATGAVAVPIHLSSTFERSAEGDYPRGFSYSRENNPVRDALEKCVAALEGGAEALAFSSGLAVATAIIQGLEPGDHIVAPDDVYWGLRNYLRGYDAAGRGAHRDAS
jgi:cystathionine gamma-synthase